MYDMEELIPIVAELSEKYTGYESSSITYEKANQLMEAVMYCIHEYEMWGGEGAVAASEKPAAKEAYQLGYRLVEEKVRAMMEMYHALLKDFRSYGNLALKETVGAIPEFLKWYDIRYAPQNTILTLDYPLLSSRQGLYQASGIDAVYEFVKCISIEQRFMNRFPETYVIQVLEQYVEDYTEDACPLRHEEIIENLCGILLADVAGHILLKKQFDGRGLSKSERLKLRAFLGGYQEDEAKELTCGAVKHFIEQFYGNDGEMQEYLSNSSVCNFALAARLAAEELEQM